MVFGVKVRSFLIQRPAQRFDAVTEGTSKPLKITPFRLLFDPSPVTLGLYGKPMARNSQLFCLGPDFGSGEWLLHGPDANRSEIEKARAAVQSRIKDEWLYGRQYYPPLEIAGHQIRWYRPVVAWMHPREGKQRAFGIRLDLPGFVKASRKDKDMFFNVVVDRRAKDNELVGGKKGEAVAPLTFDYTVVEGGEEGTYEKSYWRHLQEMTSKRWLYRNDADCAGADDGTDVHCTGNQLPRFSQQYLRPFYESRPGLEVHPYIFQWKVDFDFMWRGLGLNRFIDPAAADPMHAHHDLVVVIPGQKHDEAVIMADHYDTAYEEDVYGGKGEFSALKGHRHAAAGADDNYSATASLMQGSEVFLDLSRRGLLHRDVWLVHLTGEEFPSDCLGARALVEALKTGREVIPGRSNPKIVAVLVLDMVAHNAKRDKVAANISGEANVFQLAPGRSNSSMRIAQVGFSSTLAWNERVQGDHEPSWNRRFKRTAVPRRAMFDSQGNIAMPKVAVFPTMTAEIRPWLNPKSTLYNTDGQIFSDAGIPAVLVMEDYDINRQGYHDSKDTLENIDLDYGSAISRIAIETVAQVAAR